MGWQCPPYLYVTRAEQEAFAAFEPGWVFSRELERERARASKEKFMERLSGSGALIEEWRRAIRHDAIQWVRPRGYDYVDIEVDFLRLLGRRGFILYSEGQRFPDLRVVVIDKWVTPHLFSIPCAMKDLRFVVHQNDFGKAQWITHEEIIAALEFVILNTLYRIAVRKKELPLSRRRSRRAPGTVPAVPVRPFFRRLPSGYHPTQEALEYARETFTNPELILPEGKTFVRASFHGGEIVHDLPTEPLYRFSNDDLEEAFGE